METHALLTARIWTAGEIETIFCREYEQAVWDHFRATACKHNPEGDPYGLEAWYGTIRAAWESGRWEDLNEAVNEPLTSAMLSPLTGADFDVYAEVIEATALKIARAVVGTGRPLLVAIDEDTGYTAVFCERASELEIVHVIWQFYA